MSKKKQEAAEKAAVAMWAPSSQVTYVDPFADVEQFHVHFNLGYDGPPRLLAPDMQELREKQLYEEMGEWSRAKGNDAEQFDALIDFIYFALGYCYLRGWDFNTGWRRVHNANMLKERALPDGSNSSRGSGFDIVKPAGWEHPDLSDLVAIKEQDDAHTPATWEDAITRLNAAITKLLLNDGLPGFPASRTVITKYGLPLADRYEKGERTESLMEAIEAFIDRELTQKLNPPQPAEEDVD